MSAKHGEPLDANQAAAGLSGPDDEATSADEHVGPVAIARHAKADGRALILYTLDRHTRA